MKCEKYKCRLKINDNFDETFRKKAAKYITQKKGRDYEENHEKSSGICRSGDAGMYGISVSAGCAGTGKQQRRDQSSDAVYGLFSAHAHR